MTRTRRSRSVLHVDIETYCDIDLGKCGAHCYAAHPSFQILLVGYAIDDQKPSVIDLASNPGSDAFQRVKALIEDSNYLKCAHNAQFEMVCLAAAGIKINPDDWLDTMALANYAALPPSLAALTDMLNLGEQGKLSIGTQLIQQFCKPCAPTLLTDGLSRNLPHTDPESWKAFCEYNRRDVEAERAVFNKLSKYSLPEAEREIYKLDYEINSRGIHVDKELAEAATKLSDTITATATKRLKEITHLSNPASVPQFKQFLASRGIDRDTFTKGDAEDLLNQDLPEDVREAIELKMSISKAAIKKYYTVLRACCPDGAVKGMYQYYGSHTGRWAGRLVQLQNLRRNSLPDLDCARELVRDGDLEGLRLCYEDTDPAEVLGQLVRTVFIPSPGNKLIIADFSSIEARVIAWLAGEQWRQEVFKVDGDIYKSSYSKAFGVPVNEITKEMRQKGKIMELALGFGGGVGAMLRFGADKLGLSEEDLQGLVKRWRNSSPAITRLWRNLQDAAVAALEDGSVTVLDRGVKISRGHNTLMVTLPSKRTLYYQDARLEETGSKTQIVYHDLDQTSRQWRETRTYGGKLAENVVQAIARDCLASAMLRLAKAGYKIVSHIHDEVVIDAPMSADVRDVEAIMRQTRGWSDGLHITAKGYAACYYRKD